MAPTARLYTGRTSPAAAYAACVNGEDHDGDFRLARELMARGVQVEWLPEEQ